MSLGAGARLGPYEILAPLGAGAMGEVYRAMDTRLERLVALKVLPESFIEDKQRRWRFEREAKLLAALNHPNIAAIHAFEEISGRHLLVMEFLEGTTLREKLSAGSISQKDTVEYALQIANGLSAAHEKGIVHRDLKPANLFVTKDGQLKILDFGLAKRTEQERTDDETSAPTASKLTEPGTVVGTLAYMSPEQVRGLPVDHRSDIFSFGAILYELLSGRRAFKRDTSADTMGAILREEPPEFGWNIPPALDHVVRRCLEKDRENRFQSAKDIAFALSQASGRAMGSGVHVAVSPAGKKKLLVAALVIIPLVVAAVFLLRRGLFFSPRFPTTGSPAASPVRLSLSFPLEATPQGAENFNPLALSPDGKTLVYAGSRLFIRPLDSDEIRPIQGTDGGVSPFFSPDGLWVGFFADGKLKKVPLESGPPITICNITEPGGGGYGAGSWGVDGTIVFMSSYFSGLRRIAASGGDFQALTTVDASSLESHNFPQILPDGEHVLFEVVKVGPNSVPRAAVVSLRTGEQRVVAEDAAYPRYLPTGHLVFTRSGSLLAVRFSLKRLAVSGLAVPMLDNLLTNRLYTNAAHMAFSSDGTLVYGSRGRFQRTLVWVDREGGVQPLPFPRAHYSEVALSPDGTRWAALTIERDESVGLLIGDFARGTLTRVPAEGFFQHLVWTPNSKRLALDFSATAQDLGRLTWLSADGGTPPEPLTSKTGRQQEVPTSFSPDGGILLFDVLSLANPDPSDTGWDIYALPLGGERKAYAFLQTRFDERSARFSPNGRWVAYHSNESGSSEVFVRPYPGPGSKWQISPEGGTGPHWSQNDRELFYRNGDKMMAVTVETKPTFRAGRPRTLFEGQLLESYDADFDGKRFLMIKRDPAESGPTRVNVILNWFEEVKRRVQGAE
jgi:tRNA A-37 threonylcarbamoyl transferase component Bud32/Tol biopolymer transport system component